MLVVEDPPADVAKHLAEQAVGCEKSIKLIITLPSPENAPVVCLGDDSLVKPRKILRLPQDAAKRLVEAVDSSLDNRVREWIVQQAGGIPGVIIAAALVGKDLHRDSESLREQLSRRFRQSLEAKAGREALPILQALCPLVYVRLGDDSTELQSLLSQIAPDVGAATVLRRLGELESFGFLRKQGEYVAVVPPMFAAGLFRGLMQDNAQLPGELMTRLDLPGLKRLLERLVTLELPESTPFVSFVFGPEGPFGVPERFTKNMELLDYLARALPLSTARFLQQELDLVSREVIPRSKSSAGYLLAAINALLDEPATTAIAFAILTRLAKREALESKDTAAANDFSECFVFWYPRSMSYPEREAALDLLLTAAELPLRQLALKTIVTATNPPDTLSGRTVTARRIGSQPRYGTWRDCWDFLLRMVDRRLFLCLDGEPEIQTMAREALPSVVSRLGAHLPIEDAMKLVREISGRHFSGTLPLDPVELHDSFKWLREFYDRNSRNPEQTKWRTRWEETIQELDALLLRLGSGTFEHRLRFATRRGSDYDEVIVDGRKLYEYQVRLLDLAREASCEPNVMTEKAWHVLRDKEALRRVEFASYLGESDREHNHWPPLLTRGAEWPWCNLIGFYLVGANQTMKPWVEATLDALLASPTAPKNAVLVAICGIGPTEANRLRLKQLLLKRAVSIQEVAGSFSYGQWLKNLPPEEIRDVLEFILSEPGHEAALLDVTSLYLHHERPLPRELFPIAKRVLDAPFGARAKEGHELNQVATGLARTDLDEGLELLRKSTLRLSDSNFGAWTVVWNPFDTHGTRDFWEYLCMRCPERAYGILGEWNRTSHWPELRSHRSGHLLDLSAHHDVLVNIARTSQTAARVFAECLSSTEPGFFPFAYALVELHPLDDAMINTLNSALMSHSGFGYEVERLTSTRMIVQTELQTTNLSTSARNWLEALHSLILVRQSESPRADQSSEPLFWD